MPEFLKKKLEREYPKNPGTVYGTLNRLGMMRGNRETAKGRAAQRKHDKASKPTTMGELMKG